MDEQPLPLLDRKTLDALRDALGQPLFDTLLGKLAMELEQRLTSIPLDIDPEKLARDAHAMISPSGSLGFTSLSKQCRDVETACRQGGPLHDVIRDLEASTQRVLQEIAALS